MSLVTVCVNLSFSQLKVSSTGNVGIQLGSETPLSALSIGGIGSVNNKVDITGNVIGLNVLSKGPFYSGNWTYGIVSTATLSPLR